MTIPQLDTPPMNNLTDSNNPCVAQAPAPETADADEPEANGTVSSITESDAEPAQDNNSTPETQDPVAATVLLAALLLSRSRFRDALGILQPLLANNPNNVEALSIQGRCLAATDSKPEAMAAYASALAINPNHTTALLGCAALYKESELLLDALHLIETAYHVEPHNTDVNYALALILTDIGTHDKATGHQGWLAYYEKAVEVCPTYAPAHYNLGVASAEQGDTRQALHSYQQAVELHPGYAEAWCNMGALHKGNSNLKLAIDAYERALDISPTHELIQSNFAVAVTDYGTVLKTQGDMEGAVKYYEKALAVRPRHVEALYNLGVAFTELGLLDKAIFMYEMAIAAAPKCAEAHNNLGVIFRQLGQGDRAITYYKAALQTRPTFPQALSNLAVMYTQQGRAQEALGLLQAAVMAAPDYAEAFNNLGVLQRDVGDVHAAIDSYDRCLVLDADNRNAGQNKLLALNYIYPGESELMCKAHEEWGRHFETLHTATSVLPPITPKDRTRTTRTRSEKDQEQDNKEEDDNNKNQPPLIVGYISPDLFTHSVSYFAEAPLTHHDPSRVKTIVYSCCTKGDSKTAHLQQRVELTGGVWKNVASLSETQLATEIRSDQVDILVELTGHTANNRLGTLAVRPSPIQITWIGYPNSTGLSTVDYRITDAVCDPLDTTQTFTEELLRLPGCFLCYTPTVNLPDVAPLPALSNGFITFGSFNALAKETPEVLGVWAGILLELPTSRLVLKNKPFACESVRCQYWRLFEQLGVSKERIDLLPLVAGTGDHLSQYSMMDISLDPWPYAGTTTTAESLLMGVPCLTLQGGCHAHNVGKSLLTTVGLADQWVATSIDDYVKKAVEVAANVERLAGVREGLRGKMLSSPLCDGEAFVKGLEDVYMSAWDKWLNSS